MTGFAAKIRLTQHGENQMDFMVFGWRYHGCIPAWIAKRFKMVHITAGQWQSWTFYGADKPANLAHDIFW